MGAAGHGERRVESEVHPEKEREAAARLEAAAEGGDAG